MKGQAWKNHMQIKTTKGKICSAGWYQKNLGPRMQKANLKTRILDFSTTLLNCSSNSITYFKGDLKIFMQVLVQVDAWKEVKTFG